MGLGLQAILALILASV